MSIKKASFTLLELVSIILIASLIGVATLNMNDNSLVLARDQIISHIRYTQSLAMFSNQYRDRPEGTELKDIRATRFWYKRMWQFYLTTTQDTIYYSIFSDSATNADTTSFDKQPRPKEEIAIDPATKKYLTGVWNSLNTHYAQKRDEVDTKLNLTLQYGIERVEVNTTLEGKWQKNRVRLMFDNFGRPFYFYKSGDIGGINNYRYLLRESVQIKLIKEDDALCFNIAPITGFVSIPQGCNF